MGNRKWAWVAVSFISLGCGVPETVEPENGQPSGSQLSPEVLKAIQALTEPVKPKFVQDYSPDRFLEGITPSRDASRSEAPAQKLKIPPLDRCEDCPDAFDFLVTTREPVEDELLNMVTTHPEKHVRFRAAHVLSCRRCQALIPLLEWMCTDQDGVTRYLGLLLYVHAIQKKRFPTPNDVSPYLQQYRTETYRENKNRLAELFGLARSKEAVELLIAQVQREDSQEAVRALGEIGDLRAVPFLIKSFRHWRIESDLCISESHYFPSLGLLPTPESVDFLIDNLGSDPAPEALFATGSAKALPALKKHLERIQQQDREKRNDSNHAATRVAIIRLEHAKPAAELLKVVEDDQENPRVRYAAIEALACYPSREYQSRILVIFKSEKDTDLRCRCIDMLVDSSLDGVTPAFISAIRDLPADGLEPFGMEWKLVSTLNKRLGTRFRDAETLKAHLSKSGY